MAKRRYEICKLTELAPGERKIVELNGRSIGIFNVAGEFYALKNRCPHQGAPLCRGTLSGTFLPAGPGNYEYGLEGQVLRCPWHSWEFNVTTGQMVVVPKQLRVKTYEVIIESPKLETYPVAVEDKMVVIYV